MKEEEIVIRKALTKDIPQIIQLVRELAIYEKSEDKMLVGLTTYQDAFDAGHFEAFIVEVDSQIAGIALYYSRFSTWRGPILYLEDFIVRQQYRRKGLGKLLFECFISEARERKYEMCAWQVLDWNEPAISFYNKYDAVYEDCWVDVKMYLSN
ncbi:MAG: GNAT family N-acetyltransferase [Bacteroidetes bacterium]|nr:MAG: GNAT family N-acetyltransferase [Bacteroidota bacterium]